jgi:hypothetical protein
MTIDRSQSTFPFIPHRQAHLPAQVTRRLPSIGIREMGKNFLRKITGDPTLVSHQTSFGLPLTTIPGASSVELRWYLSLETKVMIHVPNLLSLPILKMVMAT